MKTTYSCMCWPRAYLWLLSLPGMRSPVGSIGDGRRLRHEVKDWLESSLDTGHTGKTLAAKPQTTVDTFMWLTWIMMTFFPNVNTWEPHASGVSKDLTFAGAFVKVLLFLFSSPFDSEGHESQLLPRHRALQTASLQRATWTVFGEGGCHLWVTTCGVCIHTQHNVF